MKKSPLLLLTTYCSGDKMFNNYNMPEILLRALTSRFVIQKGKTTTCFISLPQEMTPTLMRAVSYMCARATQCFIIRHKASSALTYQGARRPTLGILLRAAAARQTRPRKASSPLPPSNRLITNSAAPYLPAAAAAASPSQLGRPPCHPLFPWSVSRAAGFLDQRLCGDVSHFLRRCFSSPPVFFFASVLTG